MPTVAPSKPGRWWRTCFPEGLYLGRALISRGRISPMTGAQLEGKPEILPSGVQVLVPNEAANEAILKEFRR